MARKLRSVERGAVKSTSGETRLSDQQEFMLRAYTTWATLPKNEYISEDYSEENPYTIVYEIGSSQTFYIYTYSAHSQTGSGSNQSMQNTFTTQPTVAGLSFSTNTNYFQFNGTPSAGSEGTYNFTLRSYNLVDTAFEDGKKRERLFYVRLIVVPSGTLPAFKDVPASYTVPLGGSDITLIDGATLADAGVTYSIDGDLPSYATLDASTGRVHIPSAPSTRSEGFTDYTFTLIAEVPTGDSSIELSKSYTTSLEVNTPFGAALFSIINTNQNFGSSVSYNLDQTKDRIDFSWGSGALRRSSVDARYDTSPYINGDGYGCAEMPLSTNFSSMFDANQARFGTSTPPQLGRVVGNYGYWISGANQQVALFRWAAPADVTRFAAVAIGGGSGGAYNWASDGGGGGGLAWLNGISCEPGEEFIIGVGLGRYSESSHGSYGAGDSFVIRASTGQCLVFGQGAGYRGYNNNNPNGQSTSYFNGQSIAGLTNFTATNAYNNNNSIDAGGFGYNANEGSEVNGFLGGGGVGNRSSGSRFGGGAGGYRNGTTNNASSDGTGHGGGAGNGNGYSSTYGYSAGGGTGLDGQGWGGDPGSTATPLTNSNAGSATNASNANDSYDDSGSSPFRRGGGGGSGGSRGTYGENEWTSHAESGQYWSQSPRGIGGGLFGGGGGGSGTSYGGGHGAPGAVRIIWGEGNDGTERSFPYIYTTERRDMRIPGVPDNG